MSIMPPEEINPFRAPTATIGGPGQSDLNGDAEVIRKTYLKHEASIKGIGGLSYFAAICCGALLIFGVVATVGAANGNNNGPNSLASMGIGLLLFAFLAALYGGLGYGLRSLQPWARWTMVVLIGLQFLVQIVQIIMAAMLNPLIAGGMVIGVLIASLIPGYFLYLLLSAKGAMVFSPEYREVVRLTPHIKYKTSLLVKILLGFLVFILALAIIGGIIAALTSK